MFVGWTPVGGCNRRAFGSENRKEFVMRSSALIGPMVLMGVVGCAMSAPGAGASLEAHSLTVAAPPEAGGLGRIGDAQRGRVLRFEGEVVRVVDGSQFRVSDGTGSIVVRLVWGGPALVKVGDRVLVEGMVDDEMTFGLSRPRVYASKVRLGSGAEFRFSTERAPEAAAPAAAPAGAGGAGDAGEPVGRAGATLIDALAPGATATIAGRVVQILDTDEFRLEDESGAVRVYIGWRHRVPLTVGERVTVVGSLDDDVLPVRREFYADVLMLEDGRAVRVGQSEPGSAAVTGGEADTVVVDRPAAAPAPGRPAAATPIGSLRAYDIVLIEGTVERITDEDEFRIRDDSGSVRVYIGWRNPMPVRTGERVGVYGIVDSEGPGGVFKEVYAYEIVRADGRVIELQAARAHGGTTPAAAPVVADAGPLVTVRDVRRGQSVTLRGEVARIRDTDEFVLRDDTGSIDVYIGWRNRMPVRSGDRVTVIGFADDDVFPGMRPDIYADRLVLADGRVIVLERGGYYD
jgi:uncharacterized protein YdeI (BOF family)